ncbi:MAG: uL14 family ribosomal protein [Candidatus Micrarchaeia archaeon]
MKGLSSKISKTLLPGSIITCADNSGAAELMIIHIVGRGGRHGKMATAGVGDVVSASVKKGSPSYIKKVVKAVIIRQKDEIRRASGIRVRFEDNAGVIVGDDFLPVGTEIKGPIAREVIERYVKVAGIASRIV